MALSKRNMMLIVAAIVSAVAAISVRNRLMESAPAMQAEHPQVRILVAKRDLAVGTFVQSTRDLDWAAAPENLLENAATATPEAAGLRDNYLFESALKMSDFNGAVVRRTLHAGDPVPPLAIMKAGEGGFLAAVLEPGKRAVSIAVTATSGNAGFVSPGDHVDLIVTHRAKTISGGGANVEDVVLSETFTYDVRVVAIDQLLDNPDNKAILAKTVTVEVTSRQAEQIASAAEMGKISVALRSLPTHEKAEETKKPDVNVTAKPEDEHTKQLKDLYGTETQPEVVTVSPGRDLDIDPSQLSGHKSGLVPRVMVIHGDKSETVDFYQGRPE